ncbi:MAG: hypothetical protein DME17_01525 [Candidatus Rokuibacteriota bacterium]|nr:MAG: hypothetical protein DME17_01525 [Candidatus Rokubacteria bacterium]
MRAGPTGVLLACLAAVAPAASAGPTIRSVAEASVRVDHPLQAVDSVASRLGAVLVEPCPRFSSDAEWSQFEEARVNDVVLLMAHLEQAWIDAKAARDDTLRHEAKAPRRRVAEGRQLVDKLQACAAQNRASFDPLSVWLRIEREIPRRQAEIALPE